MRNNEEFKAEILRRKERYLKKRRAGITVLSSGAAAFALCLTLLFTFPEFREKTPSGSLPESVPDVIVRITAGDRVYLESEEVGIRMEALSQYVTLPEGDCFSGPESSTAESATRPQVSTSRPSDSGSPESGPQGTPPEEDGEDLAEDSVRVWITVTAGSVSKHYYLYPYGILTDRTEIPLTEAEFDELWKLFGTEEEK